MSEFIRELQLTEQADINFAIARLGEMGLALRRPYIDYLRDDIYELRIRLRRGHCRVLYFIFHRNTFVLLHAILKKTGKVADAEIERAIEYKLDYMMRHT
jgi:phage-related protein